MFDQNRLIMGRASWKHLLVIAISLTPFLKLEGQINDCVGAQVICDDGLVEYSPLGPGRNDFANPNNKPGCLITLENLSAWYYFEFRDDMPPGYEIEFTLTPVGDSGDKDFDFAIFGPNLTCDSLGEPVRCSFATKLCGFCPATGLGMGAREFSEGARNDETGAEYSDGFVAAMIVNPGEGFYLLLDNFIPNVRGFQLKWGGRAAPYLNCLANPQCKNRKISAGTNMQFCDKPAPFKINATATNVTNRVKYEWLGTPEALRYLDSTRVLSPTVTVPDGFTGALDYILSVTDGDCVIADAITIQVGANPPLSIEGRRAICPGESTVLSVPSSYRAFRWSNGDTTAVITASAAGTYSVTVTNEIGCEFSTQTTVTLNTPPQPSITGGTSLCAGASLRLGTDKNYLGYKWSTGPTLSNINVTAAGTYSVTVTDANQCQGVASVNIVQNAKPVPDVIGKQTFCDKDSTVLSVSNVFRSFKWSNGDTTRSVIAKQSGTYFVTVTDVNGCTGIDSIIIKRSDAPTLTLSGNRDFCKGSSTRLSINTNAFQTKWSSGDTTSSILANASGAYSVTVTSVDGCTNTATAQVRENPLPQFAINGELRICPENSAILEVPNQRFARYRWSNGDTTATTRVSQPGIYTLQATDSLGCSSNDDFTLDVFPTVPLPDIQGILQFCPDAGTTLSVDKNYTTYRWSNGDTLATTKVAQTGAYSVTVTDNNGCTAKDSVQAKAFDVSFPPAPAATTFCTGKTAALNAGAGYFYKWSTGDTTQILSVAQSGNFTVTLTDANTCQDTNLFRVQEIIMQPIIFNGDTTFCIGDSTVLRVPGFSTYKWSNNIMTDNVTLRVPGTYQVTVTDANGCTAEAETEIRVWQLPIPAIEGKEKLCANASDTLRVKGNFSSYAWSTGSNEVTTPINNGGFYLVTVTDSNGCKGIDSITVAQLPALNLTISGNQPFCEGKSVALKATPGFKNYNWSNGSTADSIIVSNAGTFNLIVTSEDGCSATQSAQIIQVPRPLANAGQNQTLNCKIRSVALGGNTNGKLLYRWTGPDITSQNNNLAKPLVTKAGTYQLMVIDSIYGCASDAITVQVTDEAYIPTIALSVNDTLDCRTTLVTVDANNSTVDSAIIYQWYNAKKEIIPNAKKLTLEVNKEGIYYFEIKDTLTGCNAIDSTVVNADFTPTAADAGTLKTLTCTAQTVLLNGSIASEVPAVTYGWLTFDGSIVSGANTLTPEVNKPGLYIFTVSNPKNGCNRSDTVRVAVNQTPPTASAGQDASLNCIVTETILNGAANANGAPFTFGWTRPDGTIVTDSSQLSLRVTQAGGYRLQVTNLENGCIAIDSAKVADESNYPTIGKIKTIDPSCAGSNDGQILIEQITGGIAPYFLSVNGGTMQPVESLKNLAANTYQIRIEDREGCGYETEATLKDGRLLTVDLGPPDTIIHYLQPFQLEAFVNVPTQTITKLEWKGDFIDKCNENCWTRVVQLTENNQYFITVTNKAGCKATDSITVNVKADADYYVPNAFSPNGDGYNEKFMIYTSGDVAEIKSFQIYSRWGNRVFEANNFQPNDRSRAWDGRNPDGTAYDPGVFVYIIQIKYLDGSIELIEGDVTLIK